MNEQAQRWVLHLIDGQDKDILKELALDKFFPCVNQLILAKTNEFFVLYYSNSSNLFSAEKFCWNPKAEKYECYDTDVDMFKTTRAPFDSRDDTFFYENMSPMAIYFVNKERRASVHWSLLPIFRETVEIYFQNYFSSSAITREMSGSIEEVFFSLMSERKDAQISIAVIEELISVMRYFPKLLTIKNY